MISRITRSVSTALLLSLAVLLALPAAGYGQTFRGGISGSVTDQSGAVVPGAQVTAVETATNTSYKTISSSAGEFAFSNLPLGSYTISVVASGFKSEKVDKVPVTAGTTYALPVKLAVASAGETVEVTADSLSLDTITDTQSTALPEQVVQNLPNSGRDFTQMLAQTPGFAGLSTGGGAGVASVNGTRSNSVNWQIEGTDNNDLWWNIPAVNQGGVSSIAGVILPVDAIENFSFVTAGTTELGRNSGGTANLTIKSGTNSLHGSAYYYNHNEAFQHSNPFSGLTTETRNQHYGFSVGGPIWKDKTFFFLAGEHQGFLIGAENQATEPSAAYQALAYQVLDAYGVPHNPVAAALLNGNGTLPGLWPAAALTGPASADNYQATGNLTGHSFNGIVKLDEQLTDKDHIAFSWFVGQGTQTAPVSSDLTPYFENAPIHVDNFSLVYNRVLSNSITNQLSAGVSYFNQVFSDADTAFDPQGLGLNTGVTDPSLVGSPHLCIDPDGCSSTLTAGAGAGFDPLGVTAPSGRNDITGHLDETLAWTKGAHQFKFGGEFRQAQVDDFYQTGQRGTIIFDGSQGPWQPFFAGTAGPAAASPCTALATNPKPNTSNLSMDHDVGYLADFLAGCFDPAASSTILGDPKRQVFVNTFSLLGQDAWQVSRTFSLNYGARYDYEGPVHSAEPNLSIFDPSLATGLAVAGQDVANIYGKFWGGISPRVGFSYELDPKTVLRGGYGFYYDSIYMKSVLQNGDLSNISVFGPGLNPAGSDKVANATALSTTIVSGAPIFETLNAALAGAGVVKISTFDKNFRPSYAQSFDLNMQHSFTPSVIFQLGYVGTKGTHLLGVFDINPAGVGSASLPDPNINRPYYAPPGSSIAGKFPFSTIDEARSNLGSIFNSLQSTLRVQNWHSLSSQLAYTWGHALDYETGLLPYVPQDPLDEKAEYGNSDFDVRNTLTGYLDYTVPKFAGPERLSKGWEVNSGFSFHGGTAYTVLSANNPSGNQEYNDRAVQVIKDPLAGVSHAITNGVVQWFNPNAFVDAPTNTYSPTRRGQNHNPGYNAVDVSLLKTTKITERVAAQFKADVFNIFNRTNLAPVGFPQASEGGTIGSTLGPYLGNPGFGPGEPLNAEFALKILF